MASGSQAAPAAVGVIGQYNTLRGLSREILRDSFFMVRDPEEPLADALGAVLDAGASSLLVLGPDALIGEVFGVHRRHFSGHSTPLKLSVMRAGTSYKVAEALGASAPSDRALRRFKRVVQQDRLRRAQLGTLKVSSSALPAARYGFSCGMGLFYAAMEAAKRAGELPGDAGRFAQASHLGRAAASVLNQSVRQLLLDGAQSAARISARVSVDGHPRAEAFNYLLASSLKESWLGIRLGEDGGYLLGDSTRTLIRLVAKTRAIPSFLNESTGASAPFETIHVDSDAGFSVDGELYEPGQPHILQIKAGPPAFFMCS